MIRMGGTCVNKSTHIVKIISDIQECVVFAGISSCLLHSVELLELWCVSQFINRIHTKYKYYTTYVIQYINTRHYIVHTSKPIINYKFELNM